MAQSSILSSWSGPTSTWTSTPSSSQLPPEILLKILNILVDRPDRDCLASLAACARASHQLQSLASPLLHRAAVRLDLTSYTISPPRTKVTPSSSAHPLQQRQQHCALSTWSDANYVQTYGQGPVLLLACRTGRTALLQNLMDAAEHVEEVAGEAEDAQRARDRATTSSSSSRRTRQTRQRRYLAAHFAVPFTCRQHMPYVCQNTTATFIDEPYLKSLLGSTTALHVAAQYGHAAVVDLLLRRATPQPSPSPPRRDGDNDLDNHDHDNTLNDFLDSPATFTCLCPSPHLLVHAKHSPDPLDWPVATPLVLALSHRREAVARQLILAGATWEFPVFPAIGDGVAAVHVVAAGRMVDMAEWLAETTTQENTQGTETQKTEAKMRRYWAGCDWPDGNGLFMLHHVFDIEVARLRPPFSSSPASTRRSTLSRTRTTSSSYSTTSSSTTTATTTVRPVPFTKVPPSAASSQPVAATAATTSEVDDRGAFSRLIRALIRLGATATISRDKLQARVDSARPAAYRDAATATDTAQSCCSTTCACTGPIQHHLRPHSYQCRRVKANRASTLSARRRTLFLEFLDEVEEQHLQWPAVHRDLVEYSRFYGAGWKAALLEKELFLLSSRSLSLPPTSTTNIVMIQGWGERSKASSRLAEEERKPPSG